MSSMFKIEPTSIQKYIMSRKEEFLVIDETKDAVGGGKTTAILFDALQGATFPEYTAIIFVSGYSFVSDDLLKSMSRMMNCKCYYDTKTKCFTVENGAVVLIAEYTNNAFARWSHNIFNYVAFDTSSKLIEVNITRMLMSVGKCNTGRKLRIVNNDGCADEVLKKLSNELQFVRVTYKPDKNPNMV